VDIQKLNAGIADLDAESAVTGWYPAVSLTAGANIVSDVIEISMPFKDIRFGDYDSYDFRLRFNQLIYDGGRLKALKEASRELSRMNAYQAEAAALGVEYLAKAAFWGVVLAEKTVHASKQSILEANNHLKDVRARHREGIALKNDVLRAMLRISQAEMDLVSREAALEKTRAVFRQVTGLEPDEEVRIEYSENEPEETITPESNRDFTKRPEFGAFAAAIASSEKMAEKARADILPDIGLFGAFNYGKPGLDLPANDWMHYFSGGVLLNWNVWDWGAASRNAEKALINRKKTQKNRDDFKNSLSRELTEAAASFNAAVKREKLASEAADFAQYQMELVNSSYRAGTATETDYDNAHAAYTRAALEKSVAKVSRKLSEIKIEYVLGIPYSGGKDD